MYGAPLSSRPTSYTRATCSLLSSDAARASRTKRSMASPSGSAVGNMNLMARGSSKSRCVAATTTPMPPRPSTLSTRYLPARMSPGFPIGGGAFNEASQAAGGSARPGQGT